MRGDRRGNAECADRPLEATEADTVREDPPRGLVVRSLAAAAPGRRGRRRGGRVDLAPAVSAPLADPRRLETTGEQSVARRRDVAPPRKPPMTLDLDQHVEGRRRSPL